VGGPETGRPGCVCLGMLVQMIINTEAVLLENIMELGINVFKVK
jgi:hypothetical protein